MNEVGGGAMLVKTCINMPSKTVHNIENTVKYLVSTLSGLLAFLVTIGISRLTFILAAHMATKSICFPCQHAMINSVCMPLDKCALVVI